jgi:hypothetical protein
VVVYSTAETETAWPVATVSFSFEFNGRHRCLLSREEAALANPNTTRDGRKRAKMELKMMVCITGILNLYLLMFRSVGRGVATKHTFRS